MDINDIQEQIIALEREIAMLPAGSITTKKVNGGIYYYHRIPVEGKRKEIYIDAEKAVEMKAQIKHRKELEKKKKELQTHIPKSVKKAVDPINENIFHTNVRIGESLQKFVKPVKRYKKRFCFGQMRAFIYDDQTEKVLILYGLRRTGKTTLIRQLLAEMEADELSHAVFMQMRSSNTLADVNADLKRLESLGYKYVFIDEVTLMQDFIEGAALFSDIFAASGMKIVLSGTDSLGFLFSEDEQLFDRCVMIHTTFIPYREFEGVLGKHGIDEYIRFGGTMSLSGVKYNEDSVFASAEKASEYVDSAIARNIQHSLQCYQGGGHFRNLRELYEKRELTSAINRVVEDMNHRFTADTLTRAFKSSDLSISAGNLRRDRSNPTDILDRVDVQEVTKQIKSALEIRNKEEQSVSVSQIHATEIREYLKLLDLITEIEIVHYPNVRQRDSFDVITQPGLRYVQADALVNSLNQDGVFNELELSERNRVLQRIRNEIKGRMMEEIVLLETTMAHPKDRVFKLQFAIGEFDMVVCHSDEMTCEIFEIKHSTEIAPNQHRYLSDEEKCAAVEHLFGRIIGKYVLYRGDPATENDIKYINVETYLNSL